MKSLRIALSDMPAPDEAAAASVALRAASVLRPTGAMKSLDDIAIRLASWQGTAAPDVRCPSVLVFAADHGVAAAGVSAYPSTITAEMLAAIRDGRATVNAMANRAGASVSVVDVGVGAPTADIRFEPAVSVERFETITAVAFAEVDAVVASGADLLILGELGIGNTTAAAAVSAHLLGGSVEGWTGRGTGVDDEGLKRKRDVVTEAITRIAAESDPLEALRQVGGSELIAMAAACARARQHRLAVLLDGYVTTSAVLPLHIVDGSALEHCIAGHVSAEGGHRRLLDRMRMQPIIDLDLRLGEASGALAALPIVQMACAAVTDVATFDEWFSR